MTMVPTLVRERVNDDGARRPTTIVNEQPIKMPRNENEWTRGAPVAKLEGSSPGWPLSAISSQQ